MTGRRLRMGLAHGGAVGVLLSTGAALAAPITVTGRLAAAPCQNNDHIHVSGGQVSAGEQATCGTEDGGGIQINDTTVARGGTLHAHTNGAQDRWADTDCDPNGDGDCNHCANDVAKQFLGLFDSYEEAKKNWQYHTHNYYLPANTTPSKSFVNAYAASHVQGFVHTNSTLHPYAGTYSNRSTTDKPGWLFVVDDHGGDLRLDSLHHTFSRHPTGASILGARMWYGDKLPEGGPYRLRSLIVDSWFSTDLGTLELPKAFEPGPTMGGGVGLAKLASGGHLLITVGPGDNTEAPHWDFFFVMGKPNGPQSVSPLGTISPGGEYDANITALSRWRNSDANNGFVSSQSQFQWSENISVITECGTGDIYVINSTSENGAKMLFGKGYYRLSRVDWDTLADHNRPSGAPKGASGPVLVPVAMGWQDLNSHECMQRAAATAYVTKDHDLELYCSEYEAIEGEEKMHFIRRRKK